MSFLKLWKIPSPSPMKAYYDNKVAISISHDPKHVEVDKLFIKEKLDNDLICMTYIPTTEQIANILTEGLHGKQFESLVGKLTMEDIFKLA